MAQDNSTKFVVGLVIILAVVGVIFLLRGGGYHYKTAAEEKPYGWSGECCTCTRQTLNIKGAVIAGSTEVLFRNEHVEDCAASCAEAHDYTRNHAARYAVGSFVSNDAECRTSLPASRPYAGGGGFYDQPTSDAYYVTS